MAAVAVGVDGRFRYAAEEGGARATVVAAVPVVVHGRPAARAEGSRRTHLHDERCRHDESRALDEQELARPTELAPGELIDAVCP